MTIILAVAICSYGALKSIELVTYDETDIMFSSRDAFFDADYVFTKDTLQYSFGLSAYDDNIEPIEDPSYGILKASYKTWGLGFDEFFQEIPTRECSEAELHAGNATDPNSKFFKPK